MPTLTITRNARDKGGLAPMFDMLPKLRYVSFRCADTGRLGIKHDAHTHDAGICILQDSVSIPQLFDLDGDDELTPCSKMLHEYAHILTDDTYHHHGIKWQNTYVQLCDEFGLSAGSVDRMAGDWGWPLELEFAI